MDPMDSAYSKLAREFQETEFPAIELMEAKFTWNYIYSAFKERRFNSIRSRLKYITIKFNYNSSVLPNVFSRSSLYKQLQNAIYDKTFNIVLLNQASEKLQKCE